ncbi:4-alpha-glucanotransferase [Chitinophaga vietnamensis]|uniref:4-alpha-glucanotransferase n=1 Tax=Chitinophaga vietnamensis TaxID=2593957 RepID=UPI0011774978|nr:4-alpha-glucanotransferase [Chitinophaga vietnamensis]
MQYRLRFYLPYHTRYGQNLYLLGNIPALGNNLPQAAVAMQWTGHGQWFAEVILSTEVPVVFRYYYIVKELQVSTVEGLAREVTIRPGMPPELVFMDCWHDPAAPENAWLTAPFTRVFFPRATSHIPGLLTATHIFKVLAPLLEPGKTICLLGNISAFGQWDIQRPLLLHSDADGWFTAALELPLNNSGLEYKYGIYDLDTQQFLAYEQGENRRLAMAATPLQQATIHDGVARFDYPAWRGAGVSVPVFSLRSAEGFGTGEFADIAPLAQWAAGSGLQLIQLLPVHDTSSTFTWRDSYPYAAISSYALHPLYIRLQAVGKLADDHPLQRQFDDLRQRLNEKMQLDYEAVIHYKMAYLRALYEQEGERLQTRHYWQWFASNEHWLLPYAVFCFLRDKYNTCDFSRWPANNEYDYRAINQLIMEDPQAAEAAHFHFFVQYHLHRQLSEAVEAAHACGVALKGDIPIGIARNSVDAWMHPELFHLDMQAGAPPDSFTAEGQNWGFPTYNWPRMAADGYDWWRQRLQHMSAYFDAFRIDHILGFFRIWQVPEEAIQGLLGYFHPAVPVSAEELLHLDIGFDEQRFCTPYITAETLDHSFGNYAGMIKDSFLQAAAGGRFELLPAYSTQRLINEQALPATVKAALYHLAAEVLFIREQHRGRHVFHPRYDLMSTESFKALAPAVQEKLRQLHHHYFFVRQESCWRREAMRKLPFLMKATDMLICGEDLGMVPHCVPGVMRELGISGLEVQRMPKSTHTTFTDLSTVPYLSVVTPSTHDMSTLRGWWKEDRAITQQYWEDVLQYNGNAPTECTPAVMKEIVQQHLQSPAMWRIFQIQELLALQGRQPLPAPDEERINIPAVAAHYWRYRIIAELGPGSTEWKNA